MTVNKLTFPSKENAVQEKINEIIDNLGGTVDQTFDGTSVNAQSGVAVADELNKYVKLNGGSTSQTISLSSGTGTTPLTLKSRSSLSCYVSYNANGTWVGSLGVNSSKRPTFYNGTSYTLAYTSEIPTVNNSTITFTQGGVTKGSITLNQANNDTIALDSGGGGGASALTDLSDVSITSAASGEALTYDGNDWINAPKTLVTIVDWTS